LGGNAAPSAGKSTSCMTLFFLAKGFSFLYLTLLVVIALEVKKKSRDSPASLPNLLQFVYHVES
jgi:hypothetical protein